jgi:hypothetical protein
MHCNCLPPTAAWLVLTFLPPSHLVLVLVLVLVLMMLVHISGQT